MFELALELWPLILLLLGIVGFVLFHRIARDPTLGVCIFVFLSSITKMPTLPVVGDRLTVADFVMLITLLVTAFQGQLFRPAPRVLRLIDHVGLLFIIIATVSSLLALMGGGDPIRVFLFLAIYIYGYLCFRVIIRLINSQERFMRVCLWWAAGAAIVIVVGFLAATGIYKPSWTYDPIIMRINSTMKMSGQVASYLAPAMFILFFLAMTRRVSILRQFVVIGLISAGAVVLIGTGSRISFVILVFLLIYGLFVVKVTSGAAVRRAPLAFAAAVGVVMFVSYAINVWYDTSQKYGLTTTSPFERAIRIFSENAETDSGLSTWGGSRYDEISLAFENFENHPFLGIGSGMFGETYGSNEIHNTYITILAENGLLAFIVFVLWWGLIWTVLWRANRIAKGDNRPIFRLILGAFLSISLYQLTTNGMRQRPFWFVPAIAISAVAISRQRPQPDRVTLARLDLVSSLRGGSVRP